MRSSDLRELTEDELKQKEMEFRKELFNLRFRLATGEVENPMRIRAVRRDIARVLTVMTEKMNATEEAGKEK